jgi:nitrile hydratase accessory protein
LTLHAGGAFEWEDFRQQLMAAVADWEREHEAAESWSYYRCWVTALERVLATKGVVRSGELEARAQALAARPQGHDHDHGEYDHDGHDHG